MKQTVAALILITLGAFLLFILKKGSGNKKEGTSDLKFYVYATIFILVGVILLLMNLFKINFISI